MEWCRKLNPEKVKTIVKDFENKVNKLEGGRKRFFQGIINKMKRANPEDKSSLVSINKDLKYYADIYNLDNKSVNEGRAIKSIQSDLDKTIIAIEAEISSYKATKGTPQEKKHVDNLKKLHPIKKKLQSELDMVVSGLYRDAELKIED